MSRSPGSFGGGIVYTPAVTHVQPQPQREPTTDGNLAVRPGNGHTPDSLASGYFFWQKWPGRNRPFGCFGTVVLLARNTGILLCNVLLVVGLTGVWAWGVGQHVHPSVVAIGCAIGCMCLYYLARCTLTEAGILPRGRLEDYPIGQTVPGGNGPIYPTPTAKLDGVDVPLKWCKTCNIYRPPRASHCRDCDCCVEEFDHRQCILRARECEV